MKGMKFKVGDAVLIVQNNYHGHKVGSEGLISKVDKKDMLLPYEVYFDGQTKWHGTDELVDKNSESKTKGGEKMHKFKKGDKVVVKSKSYGDSLSVCPFYESLITGKVKYLYVADVDSPYFADRGLIVVSEYESSVNGSVYMPIDLELYEEVQKKKKKNKKIKKLKKKVIVLENVIKEKIDELLKRLGEEVETEVEVEPVDTINNQRKEIIEKAKKFLEDNKNESGYYYVPDHDYSPWNCDAKFSVDEDNKIVRVSMLGSMTERVRSKAKAKCAPDDVFNEHIGKAIALGRAMELDVSEFEQAIQPEVAIGQITSIISFFTTKETGEECVVVGINSDGEPTYGDGMYASDYRITDDTNAEY